jgi:hypothetical protein
MPALCWVHARRQADIAASLRRGKKAAAMRKEQSAPLLTALEAEA